MCGVRLLQALLLLSLSLNAALARSATEAELRVAMIFNIARFVQWPRAAQVEPSFNLCALGTNAVTDALPELQDKVLNNQPVSIRAIRRNADLSGCHVLYVTADDAVRLGAIADTLATNPTLTISDAPSFLAVGGMVQMVVVENRLRFRINQPLAEKSNLNINAKLLQLALPAGDR